MAVITSVDILTPPDTAKIYDTNLRPKSYIYINGGTSTFQVVWEWDTVSTFNSGNLITITDSALSGFGPHSKAPNADLGPAGTTWYFRVTVTDSAVDTNEVQQIYNDATGGTFDLDFDGQPATSIPYNESAANLKTTLEALSNITAVTVTGTGTSGDPWIVTFTNPGNQDVAEMTADDTNLTGHTVGTTITTTTPGDTNSVHTEPPSGTHTLVYQDVTMPADFLYLLSNIGVGFTADGADGDPKDNPSFLYQYGNVGVGFGPGLPDGDPKDNPAFLYQYAELEPTQPCPWLDTMVPTLQTVGSSVTLTGDAFGALQTTWGGEVRLYDSAGYGGSYVVATPTFWSDKEITFVVPSGASTGWIGVVHTTGTPTCTGSDQKVLTVLQVEADPESGWYIVAADPENANVEAIDAKITRSKFKPVLNSIGTGRIDLPIGDPAIDRILNPSDRTGTLLRVYLDRRFRYGFYAEKLRHEYAEEGSGGLAIIEGRGMEAIADHMAVYEHDHPSNPSLSPTWIYGSTDNLVDNPGFDDDADVLRNPGGEEGNDDDGRVIGWSEKGDISSAVAVKSVGDTYEGDYYIEVDPDTWHSGITQSVTVEPNKVYHVAAKIREPSAAGLRITMQLGGADDMIATGTYSNNYEYKNDIYGELDNHVRDPQENGCPGGATDGTWQTLDVEVKTGDEQTSLSIAIQDDHHDNNCTAVGHPKFQIDAVEIEGWGLGLEPWKAYAPDTHASNSFRLQKTRTYDGSEYGLDLNMLSRWGGVEQTIQVTPNTKYTATLWAWTNLLTPATDTFKLVIHDAEDTVTIGFEDKVPDESTWTSYTVVFETGATDDEILLRFAYTGPNNPNPIYVDSVSLVPGEPASTAGKILLDLLAPIQARGTGDFIQVSFDAVYDSAGRTWQSYHSLDIEPGESLYQVLGRLVALGIEWNIVPVNFIEGGDTGFELNVYVARPLDPLSGVGKNRIDEPDGPVIAPGNATIGGRIVKQVFNPNVVHAIGPDGSWSEATQEPFSGVGGYEDSYGRRESVVQSSASKDMTTLSQFAEARIAEEFEKEQQVQVKMQRSASLRPFLHFAIGDSLYVDLPPYLADELHENPKRIRAISADLKDEGSDVTFRVDVDRVVYEDEMAAYAAIAQLKERSPVENSGQGTGTVSSTGSVVTTPTSPTTTTAPHTHDLDGSEIRRKAASGDVSGTLPGPLTVQALRGVPIDADIPAAVGTLAVALVYDRDLKVWIPTNSNVTVGEGYTDSVPFSQLGEIVTGTGTLRLYTSVARTIVDVRASLGTPSTNGVVTIDVNIDGTTMFTTQANRPEIAQGGYVSTAETPDVTTWPVDSYLTVDIDDGGIGAADLVVVVRYQEV